MVMKFLMNCGVCCMLISVWGILQLGIMGILFYIESPILFHNCEPKEYKNYDDFIEKTKENYFKVAWNCWVAAAMYFVTMICSCACIRKAKSSAKRAALLLEDDEYICDVSPPKPKKEKDVK